jgi:hypothetical protein
MVILCHMLHVELDYCASDGILTELINDGGYVKNLSFHLLTWIICNVDC